MASNVLNTYNPVNPFGNQSGLTFTNAAGMYHPGYSGVGGFAQGYQMTPDVRTATYTDPNTGKVYTSKQTQQRSGNGYGEFGTQEAWTDAGGVKYRDLTGFLQSEGAMRKGSDFSSYQNSLTDLLRDPSKVQQTAGYQFALDQGNQAINRSAAAKGMLNSGNVLAELAKFGQGMASQQYDTEVNRLGDLMRGAQNFGISSGYYDPKRYIATPGGTNPEYYISNV